MERLTVGEIEKIRNRTENTTYDTAYIKGDPWKGYEVENGRNGMFVAETSTESDAEFIANAVVDITRLLSEVDRLKKIAIELNDKNHELGEYIVWEWSGNISEALEENNKVHENKHQEIVAEELEEEN